VRAWEGRATRRPERDSQVRYLVDFDDGGSGMRDRAEALKVGDELDDGRRRYPVERGGVAA
jgi:hypothetical protein